MMKTKVLLSILVILSCSCKHSIQKTEPSNHDKWGKIDSTISSKIEADISNKEMDTLSELMKKYSLKTINGKYKYVTDTIFKSEFEFIIYGGFNKIDFNKKYQYSFIDSIKVCKPIEGTLISAGIGGYISKERESTLGDLVRIFDLNRDGYSDISISNGSVSGDGSNSSLDVWLCEGKKLIYSKDFSIPNLKYLKELNEYYSRTSGPGSDFTEVYYRQINKRLKPIRKITREYNSVVKAFQIIEINVENGDTLRNEMVTIQ